MMKNLIASFPSQLKTSFTIHNQENIKAFRQIVCLGMGTNAVAMEILTELYRDELSVPVLVLKDYDIPAFVGEDTLIICISNSGNTEEILLGFLAAKEKNAQLLCVTSGGKLLTLARENNTALMSLPQSDAPGRACLGYALAGQAFILSSLGVIPSSKEAMMLGAEFLEVEEEDLKQRARMMAMMSQNYMLALYGSRSIGGVISRFRQQLNENAKQLATHHLFPELNHNELVGWQRAYPNIAVFYFRNKDDHPRTQMRMEISKEMIRAAAGSFIEVYSKGSTALERRLYLLYLVDWIVFFLAESEGVNPNETLHITTLKKELSKYPLHL